MGNGKAWGVRKRKGVVWGSGSRGRQWGRVRKNES